jgi:hypothetical protein
VDLRCTCRARPILAKAHEFDGRWVLHIKVYKRQQIYAEIILESGSTARIRCRACCRWYTVRVRPQPTSVQEDLPAELGSFEEKL